MVPVHGLELCLVLPGSGRQPDLVRGIYAVEETSMSTSHYLVARTALAGWQFSHKGDITAPFETKEKAIEAAISAAGESDDPDVEVMVQDADMKLETVWRAGKP
jgi:hypothetical protein